MSVKTSDQLKESFQLGQAVTQEALYNLIESMRNKGEKIPAIDINGLTEMYNGNYTGKAIPGFEIDGTTPKTIPSGTYFQKWSVLVAGSFPGFLDADGDPLVITTGNLDSGLVDIVGENGVFEVSITEIDLALYAKQEDLEAIDERTTDLFHLYPDKDYIVDGNGYIISQADVNGVFAKNINQQRTDIDSLLASVTNLQQANYYLGSTCLNQKSRGTFYFPTAATVVGSNATVVKSTSEKMWGSKSYNARFTGNDSINISIGSIITGASNVSIWWFVPQIYNQGNIDTLTVSLTLAGSVVGSIPAVYLQYVDIPPTGFYQKKWLLSDFGSPVSFDGIRISLAFVGGSTAIGSYKGQFFLDSIVINQELKASLNFQFDNIWVSQYTNGLWTKLKNSNIPFTIINKDVNAYTGPDAYMLEPQKLVKDRQADVGIYSDQMRVQASYSAMVSYIKAVLDTANNKASTKVLAVGCSGNQSNEQMINAFKEAGVKMVRGTADTIVNYVDDFTHFGCRTFYSQPTNTLAQEDALIAAGKAYIDRLIAMGAFGCIMSHSVMPLSDIAAAIAPETTNLLHHSVYVLFSLFDYAIQKESEGLLSIVNMDDFYYSATGRSDE